MMHALLLIEARGNTQDWRDHVSRLYAILETNWREEQQPKGTEALPWPSWLVPLPEGLPALGVFLQQLDFHKIPYKVAILDQRPEWHPDAKG